MASINEISTKLAEAEALVRSLRETRAQQMVEASTLKVGAEFERGGRKYRVKRVTASPKDDTMVYLACQYVTGSGKWSQGEKLVTHTVEG